MSSTADELNSSQTLLLRESSRAPEITHLVWQSWKVDVGVREMDAASRETPFMRPSEEPVRIQQVSQNLTAVIAFSQMGTEVATASEKGTVIRVFSVNDSSKQFELRRDFELERTSPKSGNETMGGKNDHWMRYISKAVLSYLPEADS
ncbi:hypothetical protein pipiens_010580 [Culex pipiens pipiens]|uniref:Uncharacterized protein n=1 Tax=Culex pipiens pipiens TaxID=38569 RepID=A0ABD1D9K4_CULPP